MFTPSPPRVACDSLVALGDATTDGSVLFAKNSDRDPADECQVLVQQPRRAHAAGNTVRCQYVEIPQVAETARLIGSQPYWLWGFEHGVNEHGVAIGNHTVFTKDPLGRVGLLGMDLVRLGLERATDAAHAVAVITSLLHEHGQGGSGFVDKDWPYHNSFLIADRGQAYLVETSDREWVSRRIDGVGSVSNHLTIGTDWDAASAGAAPHAVAEGWWPADARLDFSAAYRDTAFAPPAISSARHARTCTSLATMRGQITPAALMRILRDHEETGIVHVPGRTVDDPRYFTVCMHAAPVGTTTASTVIRLGPPDEPIVYWGSLGSPCVGVFLPYFVDGTLPAILARGGALPDPASPWWRFHELLTLVATDHAQHGPHVRTAWDAFEREIETRRAAAAAHAGTDAAAHTAFMAHNVTAMLTRLEQLANELR